MPDLVSNSYFPAIAATELGFFAEEDVRVELELITPVAHAVSALKKTSIHFVAGAAHGPLYAFPRWRGAKLIAALARGMYWFLVVRADLDVERHDLRSLRHLRIGAAPGPDCGLLRLLHEAGVDTAREQITIQPIPVQNKDEVSFGVAAAQALAEGVVDGFWANGMGARLAMLSGTGRIILDVRRGYGPRQAFSYTFPALITSTVMIEQEPDVVAGVIRGIVRAQQALREQPELAADAAKRLFPPTERSLIAELVEQDAPFYEPAVTPTAVRDLNQFAQAVGLLDKSVPYQTVVATDFAELWNWR